MKEKMSDLVRYYNNLVEVEKYIEKTGNVSKVKTMRIVFYSGFGSGGIDHLDERIYFTNRSELVNGLNRIVKMDILTRHLIKKVDKFLETGYLVTSFTLGH